MDSGANVLVKTGTAIATNCTYAVASFAIAALTLLAVPAGLLIEQLVYLHLLFPLAIIFGHVARRRIRRSPGRYKGEGMAVFGLWVGYFELVLDGVILYATFT